MSPMAPEQLERAWIEYQQNVASLRCVIPEFLNAAFIGRQQHTFVVGQDEPPKAEVHRFIMEPTEGAMNGIPTLVPSYYVGRLVSVHTAGVILLVTNSTVQRLARDLGLPDRFSFDVGSIVAAPGCRGTRAAPLLYAASNHFRHIDEWAEDAADWNKPRDEAQRHRHNTQVRSM